MFGRRFGINCSSGFSKILKLPELKTYPKNRPNQTCDYWLIMPNQQTLGIETNMRKGPPSANPEPVKP